MQEPDLVGQLFRSLAEPTRLRILNLLRDGEQCVGDLVELLGVPQPTASRHLSQLREAGLVRARRHGPWVFYRLADSSGGLQAQLLARISSCFDDVPELARDLTAAQKLRARGGCCPEIPREASGRRARRCR
jgi:ArsR family transcriptional regulator